MSVIRENVGSKACMKRKGQSKQERVLNEARRRKVGIPWGKRTTFTLPTVKGKKTDNGSRSTGDIKKSIETMK